MEVLLASVTISAIQDNEIESPEEIIIDLVANSNYLLSNNTQLVLTCLMMIQIQMVMEFLTLRITVLCYWSYRKQWLPLVRVYYK